MTLMEAMARMEGFYTPGTRPNRNNNPGDIEWGAFARSQGATRIEVIPPGIDEQPRFAYFPDPLTGFKAMRGLLQAHYGSRTIIAMIRGIPDPNHAGQFVDGWAPAPENDPQQYCTVVCTWTGLNFDSLVGDNLQMPDIQPETPEAA
jgi:hypothetical protein